MKIPQRLLSIAALLVPLALPGVVQAKGCIKGAAIGGVAGHVAGEHGVLGAAAGCAIGHHQAEKKEDQAKAAEAAKSQQSGQDKDKRSEDAQEQHAAGSQR